MNEIKTKRILFLDADPENVNYFRNQAKDLPFPVFIIAASKTASAIDLLENNNFDLVISQTFPTAIINGMWIAERLRKGDFGKKNKDISMIAYTPGGYTGKRVYLEAGFDAYVVAPDNSNNLLKVIESLTIRMAIIS
jgi:CheY-like chemotaxis protein